MKGFLSEVAENLWKQFGSEISDLNLVFPSKRARLFFNQELQGKIQGPIWSPTYLSIDDMVDQMSELTRGHELRLLAVLFDIYRKYHDDTFDSFYFWGRMLLADFDTIDKYVVDARALYSNIADIKELDAFFSTHQDETESDSQSMDGPTIILEFWKTFNSARTTSAEQSKFLNIWNSLYAIYSEFHTTLRLDGVAYSGMQYRDVAQMFSMRQNNQNIGRNIDSDNIPRYCFIGFNALSRSEKMIFDYFKQAGDALFFWDYDLFYTSDKNHQAGRFININMKRYGESCANLTTNNFIKPKSVEAIGAPSAIMQCKVLYTKLEQIFQRQGYIDKETAVVLTDENLLIPVLHSIPDCVKSINITMGYPLRGTVPYMLLESLLELQNRRRKKGFFYRDVIEIISHPYLECAGSERYIEAVNKAASIYIDAELIEQWDDELLKFIFRPISSTIDMQLYLTTIMELCYPADNSSATNAERCEFIYLIVDQVAKLGATIDSCNITLTLSIYISLLRQRLQTLKVPYSGEPLGGLQIMGILETRCLDFDNVIYMSVTDDNFPGSVHSDSYIPPSLRHGFGLPTTSDHEAVYAYYFYRSIARCSSLTMLYCSTADGIESGEPSRYIYQLDFQSPHNVNYRNITMAVTPRIATDIVIPKTPQIISRLQKHRFSPSQINRYIDCPLKFYFTHIERINVTPTLEVNVSKMELGTLLHKALEVLYTPIIPMADHQAAISALSSSDIQQAVDVAILETLKNRIDETPGQGHMIRRVIHKYISDITTYDGHYSEKFRIQALEVPVTGTLAGANFSGIIDRVDTLHNGDTRIVDYKTGSAESVFYKGIEALFGPKANHAALQTMIYGLLYAQQQKTMQAINTLIVPAIYICPKMHSASQYSPYLNEQYSHQNDLSEELETILSTLIEELLNPNIPFLQTSDSNKCAQCDFRIICHR